jgi:hypothetical protein
LFQDRSGQTLAAFFSVTDNKNGGRRMLGLIVAALAAGGQGRAAVLSDDAQRFPQTVNSLLQRLSAELNSNPGSSKPPGGAASSGVADSLHPVAFPDNSGSISLPPGWQIKSARMGAVQADGPKGERLIFGLYVPVIDPTNPQARYMMNMETQGGRVPLPGLYVAIPYGTEPGRAYVSAAAQLAQKQGKPAPDINITKVTDGPSQGRVTAKIIQADMDAHDGKGLVALSVQLQIVPP